MAWILSWVPAAVQAQPDAPHSLTLPERPRPLLELGDPFLDHGQLREGFKLPTGAVWSPSFQVFGNFRTAIQTFDDGSTRFTEWANRLDLYANLQLSTTERFLVGFRPLDRNGRFAGYRFEPDAAEGWEDPFRAEPVTFFFEGELGQLLPKFATGSGANLDYGLSVGRQPLRLQGGLLLDDDSIDMVSITRNALLPWGLSHLKVSGFFAWDQIERNDNRRDSSALLYGISSFADLPATTLEFDLLYLSAERGDGFYAGLAAIQRFGKINTTLRVAQSVALEEEDARVGTGTLLFAELAYDLPGTAHLAYLDAFLGIDQFSSASRDPTAGGPLGRTGILFAAVGLGQYGSPLSNRAADAVGGALGCQFFFGELRRTQLLVELGGFQPTDGRAGSAGATGLRFQKALGRRVVLVVDAFAGLIEDRAENYGGRCEMLVKF